MQFGQVLVVNRRGRSPLTFASACGTATAASKGIAKRATIDRVVAALYKKMGRAIPGTIARDIEENKARAAKTEEKSAGK